MRSLEGAAPMLVLDALFALTRLMGNVVVWCLRYGIIDGGLGLTGYSYTFEGFDEEDVEEKVLLVDGVVTAEILQVVEALLVGPEGLRLEIRMLTLVSLALRGGYKVS